MAESLPLSPIPSMYVPIPRILMMKSAKMDRGMLRKTVGPFLKEYLSYYMLSDTIMLLPTTEMETSILSFWSQKLGVEVEVIGCFIQVEGILSMCHVTRGARKGYHG